MASENGAVLEARSVGKDYGGRPVLRDVSFSVAPGEQVALIGPSGSGKTTLLRLFSAVLWPSAGQVRTLGRDTAALRGHELCVLRKQVGFLHQSDNLIPGLRVAHNVLMGRLGTWSFLRALWSLFWPQEVDKAHAALQRVELGDRLWAMPGELSGGEQQRVAIARLLLQEPDVVLADEPVSSLDIRLGREVVRLLSSLARERGAALLLSLHTLELLGEGFDRVLALEHGRLIWSGRPAEVTRPLLKEVYGAEYQALHLDEISLVGRGRTGGEAAGGEPR